MDKVKIFCASCGEQITADAGSEQVECPFCGDMVQNPKYTQKKKKGFLSSLFGAFETEFSGDDEDDDFDAEDIEELDENAFDDEDEEDDDFEDDDFDTDTEVESDGLFTAETRSGFSKIKSFFGGNSKPRKNRNFVGDRHNNPFEEDYEEEDTEYYAVVEKTNLFYKGECPGISFTNSGLCNSYEECIDNIEEKLGDKVGSFNKHFDQPDPRTIDLDQDQRIVRVRPRR